MPNSGASARPKRSARCVRFGNHVKTMQRTLPNATACGAALLNWTDVRICPERTQRGRKWEAARHRCEYQLPTHVRVAMHDVRERHEERGQGGIVLAVPIEALLLLFGFSYTLQALARSRFTDH